MTIAMIEAAVDALATYLQANITAKVTELNVRYSDSVALVDPKAWYIGSYPHSIPEALYMVEVEVYRLPDRPKVSDLIAEATERTVYLLVSEDTELQVEH